MIRRLFRKLFRLALVLGAAAAVYKVVQARKPSPALPEGDGWPPTPKPAPKPAEKAQAAPVSAPPATAPPAPQAPPPTVPATEVPGTDEPAKPKAAAAKKATPKTAAAWVEPVEGACPATHPLKAKMTSLIYHLPGMTAYARTRPDRCYRDEDAAQADGLRKAKR